MTKKERWSLQYAEERRENFEDIKWMIRNYEEYQRRMKDIKSCDKCHPIWEEKRRKGKEHEKMRCQCELLKNPIFNEWLKNPRGMCWEQYLEREIKNENNA